MNGILRWKMNVIERLENVARENSGKTAFESVAGKITYGELWDRSDRLASWIDKKQGGDKTPVVVYGHKDPWMLVCFFACVKSGRAYCPVDVSMPGDRVMDIVEKLGNPLVLATEAMDYEDAYGIDNLKRSAETEEPVDKAKWAAGDELFYIIFTSGSTGLPKGVGITVDNLTNFTDWSRTLGKEYAGEERIFLNQAPLSFDLSVMDIYTGLTSGSTICSIDKDMQQDSAALLEYIKEKKVSYWVSTPSFADLIMTSPEFNGEEFRHLKNFFFCGERLSVSTARELMRRFPGGTVINTYGPTESTVAVTDVVITGEMLGKADLPIGRVRKGTEIHIIDENGSMVNGETAGEMVICGDTVSPGYYGDEVKTSAVFRNGSNGARCYRTGDRGFYGSDGMLYITGRMDLQIKFHGYRIELGDIEQNLLNIGNVKGACVLPKEKDGKVQQLVAFLICPGSEGTFAERKAIRNELKEKLPEYMVPKKIVFVDSIPITSNGKTDRKKMGEML